MTSTRRASDKTTDQPARLSGRVRPLRRITGVLESLEGPDFFEADVYDVSTGGVGLIVTGFFVRDMRYHLHIDGGHSVEIELRWATLNAEKTAYRCGFEVTSPDQPGMKVLERLAGEI